MIERKQIEEFASEIARQFSPEKIILFGSQARGTANDDSDVDMLVIMDFPERRGIYKAVEIETKINPHFSLDLLVRRKLEVEIRLQEGDFFWMDIIKEGVVLYDAAYKKMA